MAYSASNPPVVEQTTQDSIDNLQSVNLELKRFLDERKNKLSITSPAITEIHTNTVRVKKNQVANDKEFITKRGKPFPKGSLYHIHYTKNLEVYYMTGGEHSERTQLIFRNDIFDNDFDYYNAEFQGWFEEMYPGVTVPDLTDWTLEDMINYEPTGGVDVGPVMADFADFAPFIPEDWNEDGIYIGDDPFYINMLGDENGPT